MSGTAHAHAASHPHPNYVKVWATLVVLLVVSVLGPLLGHPLVTLMTAFGIAIVKAFLVAKNFMHLNIEKRYVVYLLGTCLALMCLFYFGTSPDVMKGSGTHWSKPGWDQPATSHEALSHAESGHGHG